MNTRTTFVSKSELAVVAGEIDMMFGPLAVTSLTTRLYDIIRSRHLRLTEKRKGVCYDVAARIVAAREASDVHPF